MELWAVTSYFNPAGCRRRRDNYRRFRRALGVPLLTVELFFGETPELEPADADQLVQLRGRPRNLLWQKERLLNLGFAALPAAATAVCWLDCDLLFPDATWPVRVEALLERHPLVQLFASVHHLTPEMADVEPSALGGTLSEDLYWQPSAMFNLQARTPVQYPKFGRPGIARMGNPGLAWAGRREIMQTHGLYDGTVVGYGDRLFFAAASGHMAVSETMLPSGSPARDHWFEWANSLLGSLQQEAAFVDQKIYHLWHGSGAQRRYTDQKRMLIEHAFNPRFDIAEDINRCWRWQGNKPRLEEEVARYLLGLASSP